MEQDLGARQDTHADKFLIVLNGRKYTDRPEAGAALIYLVEDHRTDHLLGRNAPAMREEPKSPELMTPKEYKAAGLGRANDVEVLRAARKRKPVSAIAVDEYNLKYSLPKGYTREGDRFVFKANAVAAGSEARPETTVQQAKVSVATVRVVPRNTGRMRTPASRMSA